MASVFRKDDLHVDQPKRNVYNKTHSKSITTKFGQIMPVLCQPVMPGESFTLSYQHIFNMLPFVFPVQTRVRANIQCYYVRWRNLWDDWMSFQFKMKPNLVKPYLKFTNESKRNLLRLGGFLDNLGVPVVVNHNVPDGVGLDMPEVNTRVGSVYNPYTGLSEDYQGKAPYVTTNQTFPALWSGLPLQNSSTTDRISLGGLGKYRYPIKAVQGTINVEVEGTVYLLVKCSERVDSSTQIETTVRNGKVNPRSSTDVNERTVGSISTRENVTTTTLIDSVSKTFEYYVVKLNSSGFFQINSNTIQLEEVIGVYHAFGPGYTQGNIIIKTNPSLYPSGIHLSDVSLKWLPYANVERDDETTIRLDAGPNRAYESVYNACIRNYQNNPLLVDGQPEYNKYLLSTEGGADTYNYPQRYANWQDDAFTTALHTPQHGDAPLVGLVSQHDTIPYVVTFANDDGTKNRVVFRKSDSSNYTIIDNTSSYINDVSVPGVKSDAYVGEFDENAIEANKFGFTINDLRNVNSYQRWQENNVRRGYKYPDQLVAHYGVRPKFDVLDMPEYLGGTSRDMSVNQVTQTVENENGALGDYAGQGYINGSSKHSITHFCDEEGFVICLLTIMPIANYSQTLPKYFLRSQAMDYYSHEFGKIGMQPILNREVDPIGSFYDGTGDKVFGYQRPWYDYLDIPDTIHGKFRTDFKNFVLTRTFDETPKLAEDFLVFNPDQVNNIFYVDDDEDKILGQILFDYKVRIPIPLYGIPALE